MENKKEEKKMEIKYAKNMGKLMEGYKETWQAVPSSRLLEGSSDSAFAAEYIGYGTLHGIPCRAIYLLSKEDMEDIDGKPLEDEGEFNWENALKNGRIERNLKQNYTGR